MSAHPDDQPGLFQAGLRLDRVAEELRSVINQFEYVDGENWTMVALRLRAAAARVHSAGIEIAAVSGWNEAAHATSEAGLIDGGPCHDG